MAKMGKDEKMFFGYSLYSRYTPSGRPIVINTERAQQLSDAIHDQEPGEIFTLVIGIRRFIDACACGVLATPGMPYYPSWTVKDDEGIALRKDVWCGGHRFDIMVTRERKYQMRLLDFSDKPLCVLSY